MSFYCPNLIRDIIYVHHISRHFFVFISVLISDYIIAQQSAINHTHKTEINIELMRVGKRKCV